MANKLYVVTRADLEPEHQAVQSAHALAQFFAEHPVRAQQWMKESNTLAMLAAPTEADLRTLQERARQSYYRVAAFHEPDRNDELTAIALEPEAKKLVRTYPLAFK